MAQVFITEESGGRFVIRGDDYHHLARVRRVKPDEIIHVRNARGELIAARVVRLSHDEIEARSLGPESEPSGADSFSLTLAAAILKGKKFDFVIQKATEAGVDRIIPLVTERTVPDIHDKSDSRTQRWNRIAREASKQCMKKRITVVDAPCALEDFLATGRDGITMIAHPGGGISLRELRGRSGPAGAVCVLVGPEGGFAPAEVRMAEKRGWTPVAFGVTTLRAETAAMIIPALILYEWSVA